MADYEPSPEYLVAREAYWNRQTDWRQACVAEVRRVMPPEVATVIFTMSDDIDIPRLTVDGWLDDDGAQHDTYGLEELGVYDALDQIAADAEAFSWEEAHTFLIRAEDGIRFVIDRA